MALIEADKLEKVFRVARHHRGFLGSVRNLLSREYHEVRAVDGISFAIERGEMVGCIGPNGAGKSTTIKMLTGILVPSGGQLTACGLVPYRQRKELARRIGVVFGQRTQLWWDLPLIESLDLLGYVYRVPRPRFQANLREFRELLDLDSFLRTPVRQLSLGQRMRGDLAAALLHEPEVVYLDEPTIGLDVVAKHRIRDFLRRINRERGVTILLTTHDVADLEQLCSRLLIVDHGKLLYDGSLEAIRERFGTERTLIVDLADDADNNDQRLDVPFATEVRADGPRRWLRFNRGELTAADLISTVTARYRIRDLSIEEPAIEGIIRR
ncbi:MAG TPA: ATP-binding cassette domain-containing protein, partial [Chloroflexota bacterium]|nr:ATP-binding cassette domain-containing protein [Chloroflexota bacterium]